MSQLAKGKSKARDPPPTLFLHPSPAASHVSLAGQGGVTAPGAGQGIPGLQRNSSHRHSEQASSAASPVGADLTGGRVAGGPGSSVDGAHQNPLLSAAGLSGIPLPLKIRAESTRATDRTDALWAEMQATLEEVELSASGGTRVFGPDHDRKLAELRAAQIALAQAWARSEADEAIETTLSTDGDGARNPKSAAAGAVGAPGTSGARDASQGGDATASSKTEGPSSTAGVTGRPGSAGMGTERLGAKMEEETEGDILLARKRREANDRYFQRVNQGVLDVVAKLNDVAVAMRAVERESKDVWGENENDQESTAGSSKA